MTKLLLLSLLICWCAVWEGKTQLTTDDICGAAPAQFNCRFCILANPACNWCPDNSTSVGSRCRATQTNTNRCPATIQNPQGAVNPTREDPFTVISPESYDQANLTNIIQLRPQAYHISLRPNEPKKFNLTFRRVIDYPLDLYYVMDLSYSMRDDLRILQNLGSDLVTSIRNITGNVRLGFGTFVDKVMMPFASTVPSQLENPCLNVATDGSKCTPVFDFRHQLSITQDGAAFQEAVQNTTISGNIDSPEGGFDALMQIAVCQDKIKWRSDALRVILFTTDASPHIAMDGKLAAILEINDMQCHLERGVNPLLPDAIVYSKSKIMDYPSIGQLKQAFQQNKIQTIFAVTQDVLPLYEELPTLLGSNTFASELAADSSNVVPLIRNAYEQLRTKIELTPPNPGNNIGVTYRVKCPGQEWVANRLQCDNVSTAQEVVFEFELTATSCPQTGQTHSFEITSNSILDRVNITIDYLCDCDCAQFREENSTQCTGRGALECGKCFCNPGYSGTKCQCNSTATNGGSLDQQCLNPIDSTVCSDSGTCECGLCQCNDGFSGKFCECRNTGCGADENGNECGGTGTCNNCNGDGSCTCDAGFSLDQNGLCTCHEANCTDPNSPNSTVCGGVDSFGTLKGRCDCNRCACTEQYGGAAGTRYCSECRDPRCKSYRGQCSNGVAGVEIERCAQCVYEQDRLNNKPQCIEECTVGADMIGFVPTPSLDCQPCQTCNTTSTCQENVCTACNDHLADPLIHEPTTCTSVSPVNGCTLTYIIYWVSHLNRYVIHVQSFNRERDCLPPTNVLAIVLPVIGGIVLIGLLALILWKIFTTIRDKKEYEQFLEDTKKSQWSSGENPLFNKPTARIENPAYIG